MTIITIANTQYNTTKDIIKAIFENNGFMVSFRTESISGKFRNRYYTISVTHNFRSLAEKLKATRKINLELCKLEVL